MSDELESAARFAMRLTEYERIDDRDLEDATILVEVRDRQIWNAAIRAAADAAQEEWDSVPEPKVKSAVLTLLKPEPK